LARAAFGAEEFVVVREVFARSATLEALPALTPAPESARRETTSAPADGLHGCNPEQRRVDDAPGPQVIVERFSRRTVTVPPDAD
jgi:hypothetical protein